MKAKCGSLLIELLIAIAIIALLATIAFPSFNFLNKQLLSVEIDKLYSVITSIQRSAMLNDKKLKLKFGENLYTFDGQKHKLPKNIKFGFKPNVKGPPSAPNKIINSAITFANKKIVFQPDGKITSGTAYLIDEANKFMYAVTIPVSEVSFIRKYRLNNSRWNLIS